MHFAGYGTKQRLIRGAKGCTREVENRCQYCMTCDIVNWLPHNTLKLKGLSEVYNVMQCSTKCMTYIVTFSNQTHKPIKTVEQQFANLKLCFQKQFQTRYVFFKKFH